MNSRATREQIVDAADRLFYRQGYDYTSFSDISDVVKISRGNFYYHFKSKDEILDAVIASRVAATQEKFELWESQGKRPEDRIRSFINMLIADRAEIRRYGCPVGTLCTELAKLNHPALADAIILLSRFRSWLRMQFTLLGREADADELAMHLLARRQGVATLAMTFRDEAFIEREVEQMCDWLSSYTQGVARAAP